MELIKFQKSRIFLVTIIWRSGHLVKYWNGYFIWCTRTLQWKIIDKAKKKIKKKNQTLSDVRDSFSFSKNVFFIVNSHLWVSSLRLAFLSNCHVKVCNRILLNLHVIQIKNLSKSEPIKKLKYSDFILSFRNYVALQWMPIRPIRTTIKSWVTALSWLRQI